MQKLGHLISRTKAADPGADNNGIPGAFKSELIKKTRFLMQFYFL